jgi:hypothetical protein
MKYTVAENFGGVKNAERYEIGDGPHSEREWRALLDDFSEVFGPSERSSSEAYEFAPWHLGMRCLFAYLYDERFYRKGFIPAIVKILHSQTNDCFAKFECFDKELKLLGCFMVFKEEVEFDQLSSQSGLIAKLV